MRPQADVSNRRQVSIMIENVFWVNFLNRIGIGVFLRDEFFTSALDNLAYLYFFVFCYDGFA